MLGLLGVMLVLDILVVMLGIVPPAIRRPVKLMPGITFGLSLLKLLMEIQLIIVLGRLVLVLLVLPLPGIPFLCPWELCLNCSRNCLFRLSGVDWCLWGCSECCLAWLR